MARRIISCVLSKLIPATSVCAYPPIKLHPFQCPVPPGAIQCLLEGGVALCDRIGGQNTLTGLRCVLSSPEAAFWLQMARKRDQAAKRLEVGKFECKTTLADSSPTVFGRK